MFSSESYGTRLSQLIEQKDYPKLYKLLISLKENIEGAYQSAEQKLFLQHVNDKLLTILKNTEPQFEHDDSASDSQKIRLTALEILHRVPTSEHTKDYASPIMEVLIDILNRDNEENAVLALKVMADLFRATFGRTSNVLAPFVQPFIDFVVRVYTDFANWTKKYFKVGSTNSSEDIIMGGAEEYEVSESDDSKKGKKRLAPSYESCKVLIDFPQVLIPILQTQTYQEVAMKNIKNVASKLLASLLVPILPPPQSNANRQQYLDLVSSRVKTVSFLTYTARVSPDAVEGYKDVIAKIVVDILRHFPNELTSSRREFFVVMKHMIDSRNLDVKPAFIPFIEQILDDKVLLGTSRTSYETLRPLAYNIIADLIHQVRKQLTSGQISKSVTFFTKVMYDPTLSNTYIQIISAKLLVHLVEGIFTNLSQKKTSDDPSQKDDKIDKKIIIHLMTAFVTKLKALSISIADLKRISDEQKEATTESSAPSEENSNQEQSSENISSTTSDAAFDDSEKKEVNTGLSKVAFSPYKSTTSFVDNVNHCRTLFRTLLVGLKNVIFVIKTVKTSSASQGKANRFSEEIKLFMVLFKYGVDCFPIFSIGPTPSENEEKQNLDNFSSLFTIIPVQTFLEIFKEQLPYLYQKSVENPIYLNIPSHFLSSNLVASQFTDLMLKFLIERMDRMAGTTNESNTMLKLFKIIIGSVVSFQNNENVLKPHLAAIVNNCLTYASRNKESINYFLTLRALFRSIVSGKFDLLVKEFLPLVPVLLEKLTEFLKGSFKSNTRELFIELCLTIPAKLHVLCQHLPMLVRPILYALQSTGKDDLVTYALRNLDIWVTSMRIESLEPILKPVMPELLTALFSHLKPAPYQYGNLAMKILARLGGINRKYVANPSLMDIYQYGEDALRLQISFNVQQRGEFTGVEHLDALSMVSTRNTSQSLDVDSLITLARKALLTGVGEARVQAYEFLKTCLLSMLDFSTDVENISLSTDSLTKSGQTKSNINIRACNNCFDPYSIEEKGPLPRTQKRIDAESSIFKSLISTILYLGGDPQLQSTSMPFIKGLCRHFAISTLMSSASSPDPSKELNVDLFLDALVDVFCLENGEESENSAAEFALETFIEVIDIACNYEDEIVEKLPVWEKLSARFSHSCYQREWFSKCGGCLGIVLLCQNLPLAWVKKHEIEFIKTLLFVIKDSPPQIAMFTVEDTKNALETVIRICFAGSLATKSSPSEAATISDAKANQPEQKKFNDLVLVLVSELSSAHAAVRKTVQSLIKLVAELSNKSITHLLEPFRTSLNNSIKEERFSGLPVHLQTGFCEAVTFFLSLDPPLLNMTPQIKKIVERALVIASGKKEDQNKDVDRKNQFALKMSCMKLLREALNSPDLKATEHITLRNKIIEIFFNFLASVNKDVVAISKSGLATFIYQQRLPKDLLQTSLRPILSNVNNIQKLTIPVLQTLSHLLELCTSYFSVKLGEQLRDHLNKWKDPNKITSLNIKADAPFVAAKIQELFALLPDAKRFLRELVPLVIQLEVAWAEYCTEYSSPFRKPLAKFLNQYPEESILFFFGPAPRDEENAEASSDGAIVIDQESAFKMFMSILKDKDSHRLREAAQDTDSIVKVTLNRDTKDDALAKQSMIKGLHIFKSLVKLMPRWLSSPQNAELYKHLTKIWNTYYEASIAQKEITYDQYHVKKFKYLLKCLINYARNEPLDVDTHILLLKSYSFQATVDYSFLKSFFEEDIPKYSVEHKQLLLKKCMEVFKDSTQSEILKIQAIQHLAIPIIVTAIDKNEDVASDSMMDLAKDMFINESISLTSLSESLKVELFQLATLFVQYYPKKMHPYRRQLAKFIFEHIKADDTASRQCALVLAAHFIKAYDSPEKIVANVYVELLKSHQSDGKNLIKQALDILVEVLPTRPYKWIRWTEKSLVEEIHSIPQLIHILQMFIRHPSPFYTSRDKFIPRIVSCLNRIGAPVNSLEHKKLALDLVELILQWEERSIAESNPENPLKRKLESSEQDEKEPAAKKMKLNEEGDSKTSKESETTTEYKTPLDKCEQIMNFIVRVSFSVFAKNEVPAKSKAMSSKALEVLKRSMNVWPDAKIQFANLEKFIPKTLDVAKGTDQAILSNILTILNIMLTNDMHQIIRSNITKFSPYLPQYIFSAHQSVIEALKEFFASLLEKFPPGKTTEVDQFYSSVLKLLEDSFEQMNEPNVDGLLTVLQLMSKNLPEQSKTKFSRSVFKLMQKLYTEHHQATSSSFKQAQAALQQSQSQSTGQQQGSQSQTSSNAQSGNSSQNNNATQPQPQPQASLRQMLTDIAKKNISNLKALQICIDFLSDGVHEALIRKQYLNWIISFLSKNPQINPELVVQVVKKLQNWLLFTNPEPEIKRYELNTPQKKHMLDCMVSNLQNSSVQTTRDAFYEVLLVLYQDNDLLKSDAGIASKIEVSFMTGLRTDNNPSRKVRFLDLLNKKLEKSAFGRLSFIFQSHRWETLNDTFWIRYALDLLVESIEQEKPLQVSKCTAKFYMGSNSDDNSAMEIDTPSDTPSDRRQLSDTFKNLLAEHSDFLKQYSSLKINDLLQPLRYMARESVRMSYDVWTKLFPLAWSSLTDSERSSLHQAIITLLARDYHSKQYIKYPNVIQALLQGISKCDPKISISPEMLKFLGKSFNAWSIAIPMMENELQAMISDGIFDERTERYCNSLAELYRVLSEDDMLCGIWNNNDISDQTKFIFSLEQQGLWSETQEALKLAMYSLQKAPATKRISHSELTIWEEHWLICAKKLQQWDELTKYAKQSSSAGLILECHWKNGQWKMMKDTFSKYPVAENQMMRIYHISAAIMENKEKEALEHFQQASQLALQRWCALPSFLCATHVGMLHNFQQLLELHESHQLLGESARPLSSSELKAFLSTWRDRVPNKWDDISMWTDILTWRCHFLKFMSKKFESAEHHRALCLNEAIWTQNKLAKICRKQELVEPGLRLLGEAHKLLNTLKIESNESFVRIHEILKCYMKEGRYGDALDLIDSDVSTKMKTSQKMDLLRLRGECLWKLSRREESYQTFSQSVSYYPQEARFLSAPASTLSLGKAFFSWGKLLDDIFNSNLALIAQGKATASVNGLGQNEIAENAIICFMQALRYAGGATNHHQHHNVGWNSRQNISRVLWLLSYDANLCKVMERCITDIPAWMWIPYIQNLFSMLLRADHEAKVAKAILFTLGKKYPQAIYYNLRSLYFELREVVKANPKQQASQQASNTQSQQAESSEDKAKANTKQEESQESTSSSSTTPTTEVPVYLTKVMKHSEELMALILRHYQSMVHEIEAILKEICARLKPELEEELQRALESLLTECYKHNIFSCTKDVDNDTIMKDNNQCTIPADIAKAAEEIYNVYFISSEQPSSAVKLSQFLKDSKVAFKEALVASDENGPKSLLELVDNIKKWLKILQKRVNLLPSHLPLESLSPYLADSHAHTAEIEIPGQYTEFDREPSVEQHDKIMCFLLDVDVIRRNKVSCRRISIRSQSGKVYRYLVQSIGPTEPTCFGRSEERTWAFIRHINRLLEKDKGSHRKNLQIHVPTVLPLSHKIRLVHERPSYVSFEEVYQDHCVKTGMNVDAPIVSYWDTLNNQCESHQRQFKMDAFNKIVDEMVPDDILLKYFNSTCLSWNELFQLRKMLSTQVGLFATAEYLFSIQDRSLHKLLVSKNTGEYFQLDFRATFTQEGRLAKNVDTVPFRLPINVQNFITPFGMQGTLLNTMSVACHGLVKRSEDLQSLLQLFLRDELIAWQSINGGVINASMSQDEVLLKSTIQENINDVLGRLRELAPLPPSVLSTNNVDELVNVGTALEGFAPMNEKISELIKSATSTDSLITLSPTLHPWF